MILLKQVVWFLKAQKASKEYWRASSTPITLMSLWDLRNQSSPLKSFSVISANTLRMLSSTPGSSVPGTIDALDYVFLDVVTET